VEAKDILKAEIAKPNEDTKKEMLSRDICIHRKTRGNEAYCRINGMKIWGKNYCAKECQFKRDPKNAMWLTVGVVFQDIHGGEYTQILSRDNIKPQGFIQPGKPCKIEITVDAPEHLDCKRKGYPRGPSVPEDILLQPQRAYAEHEVDADRPEHVVPIPSPQAMQVPINQDADEIKADKPTEFYREIKNSVEAQELSKDNGSEITIGSVSDVADRANEKIMDGLESGKIELTEEEASSVKLYEPPEGERFDVPIVVVKDEPEDPAQAVKARLQEIHEENTLAGMSLMSAAYQEIEKMKKEGMILDEEAGTIDTEKFKDIKPLLKDTKEKMAIIDTPDHGEKPKQGGLQPRSGGLQPASPDHPNKKKWQPDPDPKVRLMNLIEGNDGGRGNAGCSSDLINKMMKEFGISDDVFIELVETGRIYEHPEGRWHIV